MIELLQDEETFEEYLTDEERDKDNYLKEVAKICEEIGVNLPL